MSEIWLRGNFRILAAAAVVPAILLVAGIALVLATPEGLGLWPRVVGGVVAAVALVVLAILHFLSRQPRLAYRDGWLLVYLRPTGPIKVPIEIVEAFFLGQAESRLTGEKHARTETTTLVMRLADRADEWSHVAVHPTLGAWCDGYVTFRGTWCEPLNVEVACRLNQRLAEVKQAHAAARS